MRGWDREETRVARQVSFFGQLGVKVDKTQGDWKVKPTLGISDTYARLFLVSRTPLVCRALLDGKDLARQDCAEWVRGSLRAVVSQPQGRQDGSRG